MKMRLEAFKEFEFEIKKPLSIGLQINPQVPVLFLFEIVVFNVDIISICIESIKIQIGIFGFNIILWY